MLKVNDTILFTAQSYANSETVGTYQNTTVFVPRLIVGEQAKVKITYVKKGVAYGEVKQLVAASDKRVKPQCKYFGKCGGCSLMQMSYAEQLAFKQNKVKNNFLKIAKSDAEVLPCQPSGLVLNYRNKLSLPVSGRKGNVIIGMYRKNTHEVIDTGGCLLGGEWAAALVEIFRNYCNTTGIIPYDERTFSGEVRHLTARFIDGQLLVTVVSNGEFKRNLQPLIDALRRRFDKFGLFVNINEYKNNVILGKITKHIYGIEYIESECLGVKLRVAPNSFFQINDGVKDRVYLKTRELLDLSKTEVLIDCFSGVGVLTNVLANDKFDTYAIEIEPSAVADAKEAAKLNSAAITNICGDVNIELPKLVNNFADKVITLVVDPPRKGLGESICNTVKQANVDNIVYISCDSATLARDVALLSDAYDVVYVEPYDMFPNTDQVETLVRLARKTDMRT